MSVRSIAKVVTPNPPRPGSPVKIRNSIGSSNQFNPFYYLIISQFHQLVVSQLIPIVVKKQLP